MNKFLISCMLLFAALQASSQIPNNDMEQWDNQPVLIGWQTNSHPLTLPPFDPYVIKQDSDRYTGQWAADFYGNGVFKPSAVTTFPVNAHPHSLSLYYKLLFPPCINDAGAGVKDTASVLVEILNQGVVVDRGYWEAQTSVTNYTKLIVPISQNGSVFDSCRITLLGGKVRGGCGIVAASTEFKVDHLTLNYSNSVGCVDSSKICDTCFCVDLYDPVCGCDGNTYANSCDAQISGLTSWTPGECGNVSNCRASFYFTKHIDTVAFNNQSIGNPVQHYLWDFDDSGFDTVANPVHVFADGSYKVCLYINGLDTSNQACHSSFCDTILITHNCIDSSLLCGFPLCCDFAPPIPVCGCDSVTYYNACEAEGIYGVAQYHLGACINGIMQLNALVKRFTLIPNPATDKTTMTFETQKEYVGDVVVRNMFGQIQKQADLGKLNTGGHSSTLDISDLPSGIYLVELRMDGRIGAVRKLVKE